MIAKPPTQTDSRAGDEPDRGDRDDVGDAADGRYRIERELGRGGRGRVWLARDTVMDRAIAIKQPARRGELSDARFAREAQITGQLQHPAIVPVYEVGTLADGSPFYAMKLVEGATLRDRIAAAASYAERVALLPHVVVIADAVAYAHDRGVIHRDLKPANVVCGRFGETVVLDWGLAKPSAVRGEPVAQPIGATATVEGAVVGTPAYMAPEQARGDATDARADVYAIGAIVYHLIAGAAPYEAGGDPTSDAVIARVIAGPPAPLAGSQAPVDLVAIVERAMARDPSDRYAGAGALADDLRRFIAGRLVNAHAYSRLERAIRWCARHRAIVALGLAALAFAVIVAAIAMDRIVDERDDARAAHASADARADALVLAHAREVIDRDPAAALAWLKQYRAHDADWTQVRALALDTHSRGPARHVWRHRGGIGALAVSSSGRFAATGGADLAIQIWDTASGRRIATLRLAAGATRLAFTRDERMLVGIDFGGVVHLHDLGSHTTRSVPTDGMPLFALAIAPDDTTIVVGGLSGRPFVIQRAGGAVHAAERGGERITAIAITADHQVVTGASGGAVDAWSPSLAGPRHLAHHEGAVGALAIADGAVISVGDDALVRTPLEGGPGSALPAVRGVDLAVASDGTVAVAGHDGRVRLAGARGLSELALPDAGEVYEVAWSADRERVVAGIADGRIIEWTVATGARRELARHGVGPTHVAFAPDGSIAAAGGDGVVRWWRAPSGDGSLIARDRRVIYLAAARDGTAVLTDDRGGVELITGGVRRTDQQTAPASAVLIADDTRTVWVATWDRALVRWDGTRRDVLDAPGMTWSLAARGERVAASGSDGIHVWDRTGLRGLRGHTDGVRSIAFLPDDAHLLSGSTDRTVRLWSLADGTSRTLATEAGEVYLVAVSADGAHAVSVTLGGVRLWTTADWSSQPLATPAKVRSIAFSPDGTLLAATTAGPSVVVWDVASGGRHDLPGPARGSNRLAFAPADSPERGRFASTGSDGTVRVWDPARGLDRIVHRFGAEAYDIAWTTAIVASGGDRTVWTGSGAGAIVGTDPAAVAALLDETTATVGADGAATDAP